MPSLLSELARTMKKQGMRQEKIASCLELTPSAVSQYLKGKRGRKLKFGRATSARINNLAREIGKMNKEEKALAFCDLCKLARRGKALCSMHREFADMPVNCDLCQKTIC